ncbi:MAG: CinA family protein [Mycoplasmataceae bacterium]|nr:CinA family protein [Mycoplasmataceae bacterium]
MLANIKEIVDLLIKHKLTLSTCESVTCGTIGSLFGHVPGVSNCYCGGFITYNNEQKIKLVNVNEQDLKKYGAVSSVVAEQMALGCKNKTKSTISLSITGNAGPNPMENKPVGLAYVCIVVVDKAYAFELHSKETNRERIILDLSLLAIDKLFSLIKKICK